MAFITFEGIDGSGKTTIMNLIKTFINESYSQKEINLLLFTREPGGNQISEKIREVILNNPTNEIDAWTEALLYIASRNQLLKKEIYPFFVKAPNGLVLCDRYYDSTIAYQGHGRGLSVDKLKEIQTDILGMPKPDLTFYFRLSATEAQKRSKQKKPEEINRIDQEVLFFHQKVLLGFEDIIKDSDRNFIIINAEDSIKNIVEKVIHHLQPWLKKKL